MNIHALILALMGVMQTILKEFFLDLPPPYRPKYLQGAEPCLGTAPPSVSTAMPAHWASPGLVPSFQAFARWFAGIAQTQAATSAIARALQAPLAAKLPAIRKRRFVGSSTRAASVVGW